MIVICRSCNHEIVDNFCPHCGQKKTVRRITWSIFAEELAHLFTHIEKGFLRTFWQMLRNPGRLMKSYLDGQRKKIQRPISYFVIWASIFYLAREVVILLFHNKVLEINTDLGDPKAGDFYWDHPTAITILLIPIWAFIAWLISYRKRLNFLEVIITCFYGYGQYLAYVTIFYFIGLAGYICGLIKVTRGSATVIAYFILVITVIDSFWKNYSLLREYKIKHKVLRLITTQFVAIFVQSEFIVFIFFIVKNMQGHLFPFHF